MQNTQPRTNAYNVTAQPLNEKHQQAVKLQHHDLDKLLPKPGHTRERLNDSSLIHLHCVETANSENIFFLPNISCPSLKAINKLSKDVSNCVPSLFHRAEQIAMKHKSSLELTKTKLFTPLFAGPVCGSTVPPSGENALMCTATHSNVYQKYKDFTIKKKYIFNVSNGTSGCT